MLVVDTEEIMRHIAGGQTRLPVTHADSFALLLYYKITRGAFMLHLRSLSARRRLIGSIFIIATLFALSYINNNTKTVAQITNATAVVGIARTPDVNPTEAEVDAAVREAILQAGGLPANVGPGKKIIIQPNLVEAGWPSSDADPSVPYCRGVVTDVRVVRTIVNMCIEAGAAVSDITICEGAAGFRANTTFNGYGCREATKKAFYDAGFDLDKNMIDDATGVRLLDANFVRVDVNDVYPPYPSGQNDGYNPDKVSKVQFTNGPLIDRNYFIPTPIVECDVLIRVPVLKTHDLAGYTGALKLAFGLAPSDIYHVEFSFWDHCQNSRMKWNLLHQQAWGYDELQTNSRGMVDMTLARPPDMVVVDGLVGITTGPTRVLSGETVPRTANPYMRCIIASHDCVAADTVATLAIGYKVNSIPGIGLAADAGLGQDHPGLIDIRGVQLEEFRQWWPDQPNSNSATGIPGNTTIPYISDLTIPDGAHAGGTLKIKPKSVMSMNGICKSELYVDGDLVDRVIDGSVVTWNVGSGVSEGAHQVSYVYYDMMLNKTTVTRTVNVHKGNTVTSILAQPDGTTVFLSPVYMTGRATTIDNNTFFVSTADGISGMKVVRPGGASNWPVGYEFALNGTLGTVNGQRVLTIAYYSYVVAQPDIAPRIFQNSALGGAPINGLGVFGGVGPHNLGCLVKTMGRVSAGGSNYFYIDDGSLSDKLKVYSGSLAQPVAGSYVCLTGWSCAESDGGVIRRLLVLRSATDIATLN